MSAPGEFALFSVSHLESPAGIVATSLESMAAGIASAPPLALFHHVARLPLRFPHGRDLPANDFARWARTALQDPETAEQLAYAGAPSLTPIETLRASLLAALEKVPARRRQHEAPAEAAFQFVMTRSVPAPMGESLGDPRDISTVWPRLDRACLFYHLIEAPLLGPEPARLAVWLDAHGAAGLARVAEEFANAGYPMGRLHRELGTRWRRKLIPGRLVQSLEASEGTRRAVARDTMARLAGRLAGAPHVTPAEPVEPPPLDDEPGAVS